MKKDTIAYFDGLNLQHQLLRVNPKLMWLDPFRLAEIMLGDQHNVTQVNYYAARFYPSDKADRQAAYFNALKTHPKVKIYYGEFKTQIRTVKLVDKIGLPKYAEAYITEEKKTDVNLTCHLVRDAFLKLFEVAVVITNDTDFAEAIRIVTQEANLPVGILSPATLLPKARPHDDLVNVATFIKRIRKSHLRQAQFPPTILGADGTKITCPPEWS